MKKIGTIAGMDLYEDENVPEHVAYYLLSKEVFNKICKEYNRGAVKDMKDKNE